MSGDLSLLAQGDDVVTEAPTKPVIFSSENTSSTQYTVAGSKASKALEIWICFNPRYLNESNISFFRSMWQGLANLHLGDRLAGSDFEHHQGALFYMKWTDYRVLSGPTYTFNIYKSVASNRLNISKENTVLVYSGTDSHFYLPATILSDRSVSFYWIEIIAPNGTLQTQSGFMQMSGPR